MGYAREFFSGSAAFRESHLIHALHRSRNNAHDLRFIAERVLDLPQIVY